MTTQWLAAALDYLPRWLGHQRRITDQPGVAIAVAERGRVVWEWADGWADATRRVPLTPKHVFRVASHSKSFTAAALLRLREQGRVRLDDEAGRYVAGLHPQVARRTLAQLLSHSAGLVRDGPDAGQWLERRDFLDDAALRADLADAPTLDGGTRFKYSNHGFGLLGLVIEAVTGERYHDFVAREVVAASGLESTWPDVEPAARKRLASGHSGRWPLDDRLVIPATMSTHALASATGFISSAGDLARFFWSLAPEATKSVLSADSRRELTRRQWREPHAQVERWYGLGTMQGTLTGLAGAWNWFGHTGGFPGTLTRTVCVPEQGLSVSVLTNAADGPSQVWTDGALHVLQAFAAHGAPSGRTRAWQGRWWSLWQVSDLLPTSSRVLVANPALANPVMDAAQIEPGRRARDGSLQGRITLANGFQHHGEPVALGFDAKGRAAWLQLAGARLLPEAQAAQELRRKYGGQAGRPKRAGQKASAGRAA